jgi:hypothetical protein
MQGFQDILPRGKRKVFTAIFPKNAKLFLLYETDKTAGKDVSGRGGARALFAWIYCPFQYAKMYAIGTTKHSKIWQIEPSVSTTFGLKLYLVLNARRKFVKFSLKPRNLHDVSCTEEVLVGRTGTMIGDDGYVSAALKDSLTKGYTAYCQTPPKHGSNLPGRKRFLKKRSIVETMIGRFKNFFGKTLPRFHSP